MANANQPKEYDAVKGGEAPAPSGGMVLGGIEGVKKRWASGVAEQQVAAIKDAVKYGNAGLELVIKALNQPLDEVQKAAYLLLRSRKEAEVRKALTSFNQYQFFDCIRTIIGGTNIALSGDGKAIAYLRGKAIKVCNLKNELLYSIPKYPRAKESFAISSDGETLVKAVNTSSYLLEIWQEGEKQHALYGHELEISAIAMLSDGKSGTETPPLVATGSHDTTIKIWNLDTGKLVFNISRSLIWGTHTSGISCLAFTPDGKTLVSGSADSTIKLWNLRTRDKPRTLKGHTGSILAIAIGPDGQTMVSSSNGWPKPKIKLWHLGTGELIPTFEEQSPLIGCFAFSPDGRILAGGSYNTIVLWKVKTGEVLHILEGHESSVTCLAFSRNGHTLISGSEDKTIKVWGVQ